MRKAIAIAALLGATFHLTAAEGLDAAVQTKIDAATKQVLSWASDPALVGAVKAYNTAPPAGCAVMTQEKWGTLPILDPFVRSFSKNPAAAFLKGKKNDAIAEAFVSGADGTKVAFLSKPSNWSHQGKPKHDLPMTGKTWQGPVELDASTGLQQVQVAVPVLEGDKAIGSLVVGLSIAKLAK